MKFLFKKTLKDPNAYKGKTLTCTCVGEHEPKQIKIERVVGSMVRPTRFEVTFEDQQHLIVMLDFFAQVNGEHADPEVIAEFDKMEYFVAPESDLPDPKKLETVVDQALAQAKECKDVQTH